MSVKTEQRDGLARLSEATEFLGISRASLYVLMDRGVLPFTNVGLRCRRIPWRALESLVEKNLIGGSR